MAYTNVGYLFTGKQAKKGGGDEYWTGRVTVAGKSIRITVFKNKKKGGSEKPDLIIYGQGGGE
jgi:hypothetical protein